MMSITEIETWIHERHGFWWNHLLESTKIPSTMNKTCPRIKLTTKIFKSAGCAGLWMCEYNLCYAYLNQDRYEETIAHEVSHTMADRIANDMATGSRAKHGFLWMYLFKVVCGFNRGRYNHYTRIYASNPIIKKIRKRERIQKAILKAQNEKD